MRYIITISVLAIMLVSLGRKKLMSSNYIDKSAKNQIIGQFWNKKTFASKSFDVVLCGDSRVYRGLSPKHINEELDHKLKILNFGYSSTILNQFYIDQSVSKLLERGKRLLIIGVSAHSFVDKKNEALIKLLKGKKKNFNSFFFKLMRWFPQISPENLIKILRKKYKPAKDKRFYKEIYYEDGWVSSDRGKSENTALYNYKNIFKNTKVSKTNINKFINSIKILVEGGYNVIMLRTPTSTEMKNLEDEKSGFDEIEFVKKVKAVGALWFDVSKLNLRSYDGSHLDSTSAVKLSRNLGKYINDIR